MIEAVRGQEVQIGTFSPEREQRMDTIPTPKRRRVVGGNGEVSGSSLPTAAGLLRHLRCREMSTSANRAMVREDASFRFKNMDIAANLDCFSYILGTKDLSPGCKCRSVIVEIVSCENLLFALTASGACVAYNCDTKAPLCTLNKGTDGLIRSLFYNRSNHSLITVSVYRADNYGTLHCRSIPLDYIRRGTPELGYPIFETESLKWPGFVEFDDVNAKVLTFSASDRRYKVWDISNYSVLYEITKPTVLEVKISPSIMLLIHKRAAGHVPLEIVSMEDGKLLKSIMHPLHRSKKVDFIEQFNEKLLVKQEGGNLQIVDIRTNDIIEVDRQDFPTPSAFIFLYENDLFLTFRDGMVSVWNFQGQCVTSFEDHKLWCPEINTNNIYITGKQNLILSYCKSMPYSGGSINVSDVFTGKCVAKLSVEDARGKSLLRDVGEEVTALFFNEERNEVYTGCPSGSIQVWAN